MFGAERLGRAVADGRRGRRPLEEVVRAGARAVHCGGPDGLPTTRSRWPCAAADSPGRPHHRLRLNSRVADSAYARAGVDTGQAGRGVAALVDVLRTIDTGRGRARCWARATTRTCCGSAANAGLALSTDGVGTKLIVAEQLGRFDTVGIDCIAMNVNDVICVGADPIAVLDYIAVEQADDDVLARHRRGPEGRRRGRGRGDPGRRAGRGARADPRPPVARRDRPGGHVRRAWWSSTRS